MSLLKPRSPTGEGATPIASNLRRLIFVVVGVVGSLAVVVPYAGSQIQLEIARLNVIDALGDMRNDTRVALDTAPAARSFERNPAAVAALVAMQGTLAELAALAPDDPLTQEAQAAVEEAQQHLEAAAQAGEGALDEIRRVQSELGVLSAVATEWKRAVDMGQANANKRVREAAAQQRQLNAVMNQLSTAILGTSRIHREIDAFVRYNQSVAGQEIALERPGLDPGAGFPEPCDDARAQDASQLCRPSTTRIHAALRALQDAPDAQIDPLMEELTWALQAYERAGEARFAELNSALDGALNAAALARRDFDTGTAILGGLSRLIRAQLQAEDMLRALANGNGPDLTDVNRTMQGVISQIRIRAAGTMTALGSAETQIQQVEAALQDMDLHWGAAAAQLGQRNAAAVALGDALAKFDAAFARIAEQARGDANAMVNLISATAVFATALLALFVIALTWVGQVYVVKPLAQTTRAILALARREPVQPVQLGARYFGLGELEDALENLRQMETQFQTASQLAHIGRWRSEVSGKLVWSPETMEMLGVKPEEFTGHVSFFTKMMHPDDMGAYREARERAYATGDTYQFVHRMIRPDGKILTVFERAELLRDEDGAYAGMSGVIQDITATVDLEQRLRQSQKLEVVGQLSSGVAHDFNNLLAVILGNLELIQEFDDPEKTPRFVDAAITAALRGADLTQKMLTFAQQSRLEPRRVDLAALVDETRGWSGRILPANVAMNVEADSTLWDVFVDEGLTQTVLLNLMVNARDAMPEGGTLDITLRNGGLTRSDFERMDQDGTPGKYVIVEIRDSGVGIPEENLDKVFEPFFTTKPAGAGSGLGLSMIKGFMEQSKGAVTLESTVGTGTKITLYFPEAKPDTQAPQQSAESLGARPAKAARILLVEDEAQVRHVLTEMLAKDGYDVHPVASGDEAFALWQEDRAFDLVITDVVMPGTLQGTDLIDLLRQGHAALPVIVISGNAKEGSFSGRHSPSGGIYLAKPVRRRELNAAVYRALGTQGPTAQAGA